MSKVFLIPGLGADTRVFNNIELLDNDVIPVNWIEPTETDTLNNYAQKLIIQYDIKPNSILIGNSLGGMIGVEIAKIIPIKKLFLISSIKSVDEAPGYFSLFRAIPVYKLVPAKWLTSARFFIRFAFGRMNDADKWLFNDMLSKTSPAFMIWAMGAILRWDNKIIPPNLYHITGDKDMVFSFKRIKGAIIVKGGTHIMIFDKAKEINKLIKGILKK